MSIGAGKKPPYKCLGFSVVGWIFLLIPLAIVILLALFVGAVEGRKAYWDYRVRAMCEQDGGVRIFARVHIRKSDLPLLGQNDGRIAVPIKGLAPTSAPVYGEMKITRLRDYNPEVRRTSVTVIRRADQQTVAEWIHYSRIGGDLPTGITHHSTFGCPDLKRMSAELEQMFIVEGNQE